MITIHITGQSAKIAPLAAAENAIGAGKRQMAMAMTKPTLKPASAACHAGRLNTPRSTNTVAMGNIATKNDNVTLWPTGVNNC